MTNKHISQVVILSGGGGTRLWPMSTPKQTKPFLKFPQDKTLLEQAYLRAKATVGKNNIWVITNEKLVKQTLKVLPEIKKEQVIGEPLSKNTAPAIALAACLLKKQFNQPVSFQILPADHYIPDITHFADISKESLDYVSREKTLLTFGIKPNEPKTGYGYIQTVEENQLIRKVRKFIEKPNLRRAKIFVKSKQVFWNSGIFCWNSEYLIQEMIENCPEIINPFINMKRFSKSNLAKIYSSIPSISIDYALMEKSKNIQLRLGKFRWSDLGNWFSVFEAITKDTDSNVLLGTALALDSHSNLVFTKKPVKLFGVDQLVVIESDTDILVTTLSKAPDLKLLLEKFK